MFRISLVALYDFYSLNKHCALIHYKELTNRHSIKNSLNCISCTMCFDSLKRFGSQESFIQELVGLHSTRWMDSRLIHWWITWTTLVRLNVLNHCKELAQASHLFENCLNYIGCVVFLIHWKNWLLRVIVCYLLMRFTCSHAVRPYWKMCKNAVVFISRIMHVWEQLTDIILFIGLSL